MDLTEVFHNGFLIQRRGIIFSETPVFQTTANRSSPVCVVYHVHLVPDKKVKIGGIFNLSNPDKLLFKYGEVSTQTYADSGGEGVLFFIN